MLLEKYFFINHLKNDFSLSINLLSLVLFLIIILVFYLISRKKETNITDLILKPVIFFIIFFAFLIMINEINWLVKDFRDLHNKSNIEKASVLYSRYFYSDRLFFYLNSVKENTKKNKTAILITPNELDRVWLKYYLYPDIKIVKDDSKENPNYFLVFIDSKIYPNASLNINIPGFKLIKELSNTEKIYVNTNF